MRKTYLGEFKEIVPLTVAILDGEAYSVTVSPEIEQRIGCLVSSGN